MNLGRFDNRVICWNPDGTILFETKKTSARTRALGFLPDNSALLVLEGRVRRRRPALAIGTEGGRIRLRKVEGGADLTPSRK